jgi:hypothetical protein
MRRFQRIKSLSMLAASLGLIVPSHVEAAPPAMPVGQQAPAAKTEAPLVVDVALGEGGRLSGQLLDRSAAPVAGKSIFVLQQGRLVASTYADAAGRFKVDHLPGGVYEVRCDGGASITRLWAPQTAPPVARPTLLVSCGGDVVRGQGTFGGFHGDFLKGPGPWIIAVATIVAVPTALALGSSRNRPRADLSMPAGFTWPTLVSTGH